MVPSSSARISEYVASSECPSSLPPVSGVDQDAASGSASVTTGTALPAGKRSVVPASTRCSPGAQETGPLTVAPSTSPRTPISTGARTCRVTGVLTSTLVASVNAGGGGSPDRDGPSTNTATSTRAGTASAVSLSQYWNAWTKVIERMPPKVTLAVTTRPTATT